MSMLLKALLLCVLPSPRTVTNLRLAVSSGENSFWADKARGYECSYDKLEKNVAKWHRSEYERLDPMDVERRAHREQCLADDSRRKRHIVLPDNAYPPVSEFLFRR